MKRLLYLALIILIVAAGVYLGMYPKFPPGEQGKNNIENFSSPAVAPQQPKCIQRSTDAMFILRMLPACDDPNNTPSTDALDREELKLILKKLTCLDSDVANNGIIGYSTLNLPYNVQHDIEPLTNFVGRCLNNGTQTRDLELLVDKYEKRGKELISRTSKRIGMDDKALLEHYQSLLLQLTRTLNENCLAKHSSLDRPFGPRDPGFSTPFSVEKLAPFNNIQ
jgi:hypothetical protein